MNRFQPSTATTSNLKMLVLLGVLLLGTSASVQAQNLLERPDVTVDLGSGAFSKDGNKVLLPFDVPFDIVGAAAGGVKRIEFAFLPACLDAGEQPGKPGERVALEASQIFADSTPELYSEECGRVLYFHTKDNSTKKNAQYLLQRSVWSKTAGTSFRLPVGPLHAGRDYVFYFRQHKPLDQALSDFDPERAFEEFSDVLRSQIFKGGALIISGADGFKTELETRLKPLVARAHGVREDDVNFSFPSGNAEKLLTDVTLFAIQEDANAAAQIKTFSNSLDAFLKCDDGDSRCVGVTARLRNEIEKLISGDGQSKKLSARTSALLATPLNSARFGAMSATEAATIIHSVLAQPGLLSDLATGKQVRISGAFVRSDPPFQNSEFIGVLRDYIGLITTGFLRYEDGEGVVEQVAETGANEDPLIDFRRLLDDLLGGLDQRDLAKTSKQGTDNQRNFVLALKQALQSIDVSITGRAIDNQSDSDVYVSLDTGLGYAGDIGTSFYYTGATIYLAPVNNRAPVWSTFRGRDRFTKTVGLVLGITDKLDDDTTEFVKDLTGSGSIVVGLNWRFNRTLRLSLGALLYKEIDSSPLVTDNDDDFTPFVALTLDLRAGIKTITEKIFK